MSTDNVTAFPGTVAPRTMTHSENEALQAIRHARAIADAIYSGTSDVDGSFLEELEPSSVNSLMGVIIEKLDQATEFIERPCNT